MLRNLDQGLKKAGHVGCRKKNCSTGRSEPTSTTRVIGNCLL